MRTKLMVRQDNTVWIFMNSVLWHFDIFFLIDANIIGVVFLCVCVDFLMQLLDTRINKPNKVFHRLFVCLDDDDDGYYENDTHWMHSLMLYFRHNKSEMCVAYFHNLWYFYCLVRVQRLCVPLNTFR